MPEFDTHVEVQSYLNYVFGELAKPFHESLVKWRVMDEDSRDSKTNATEKLVFAFVDARDVQERLDEVMGPENWSTSMEPAPSGISCTLYLYLPRWANEGTEWEWVSKTDVAGPTEVESFKGAGSTAFKRAASAWKIGRYLYDLGDTYVLAVRKDKNRYEFNAPELPEFARPTSHSAAETERVKRVNQNLTQLRRKVDVPLDTVQVDIDKFTEKEILETELSAEQYPSLAPAFHGKTIEGALKFFGNESNVINFLAGTITAKNGDTFTPKNTAEKLLQEKALVYKQIHNL